MCDLSIRDTGLEELMHIAKEAREHAYAPYSKYKVGAALLTDDGRIYTGANMENATYGATICAERVAIYKAIYDGARNIEAVAIAGNEPDTVPCGICLQVMIEFLDGKSTIICTEGEDGKIIQYTLDKLLPHAFRL